MKVIVKPLGIVVIVGSLLGLSALALRGGWNATPAPEKPPISAETVAAPGPNAKGGIYGDTFANGWTAYGWARELDWASAANTYGKSAAAIRVRPGGFEAAYFHHPGLDTRPYDRLTFRIHGGTAGGQRLRVDTLVAEKNAGSRELAPLRAGEWTTVTLPLKELSAVAPNLTGFWIQEVSGSGCPEFFVDDVRLLKPGEQP